jgi:hypothetical protein
MLLNKFYNGRLFTPRADITLTLQFPVQAYNRFCQALTEASNANLSPEIITTSDPSLRASLHSKRVRRNRASNGR